MHTSTRHEWCRYFDVIVGFGVQMRTSSWTELEETHHSLDPCSFMCSVLGRRQDEEILKTAWRFLIYFGLLQVLARNMIKFHGEIQVSGHKKWSVFGSFWMDRLQQIHQCSKIQGVADPKSFFSPFKGFCASLTRTYDLERVWPSTVLLLQKVPAKAAKVRLWLRSHDLNVKVVRP